MLKKKSFLLNFFCVFAKIIMFCGFIVCVLFMVKKKIILFGGTFDPVHCGHLKVASESCDYLQSERLVFIPAKRSPLKHNTPEASDEDRLHMIRLSVSDKTQFEVDNFELKGPEPSYTLNTVRYFRGLYPECRVYWLLGADSIAELPKWYCIDELLDECTVAVVCRGGCRRPDFPGFEDVLSSRHVEKLREHVIPTSEVDISSTEIRARIREDKDISGMVHPAVAEYIEKHRLYR